MKCLIFTPKELLFSKEVKSLIIPALDGSIGIEENHAPMIVRLKAGAIQLHLTKESHEEVKITQGFAQVRGNVVTIAVQN